MSSSVNHKIFNEKKLRFLYIISNYYYYWVSFCRNRIYEYVKSDWKCHKSGKLICKKSPCVCMCISFYKLLEEWTKIFLVEYMFITLSAHSSKFICLQICIKIQNTHRAKIRYMYTSIRMWDRLYHLDKAYEAGSR